jgi:uncharacterized membrane protein YuzA (DUF378 family)
MTRILGANTPEKRVNVGLAFDALTLVFSALLLVFLFGYFDGRYTRTGESAPTIVYLVYVFLGLTAIWQLLSLVVGISHKNKLSSRRKGEARANTEMIKTAELTDKEKDYLPPADTENIVPPSVTEDTTKLLDKIPTSDRRRERD